MDGSALDFRLCRFGGIKTPGVPFGASGVSLCQRFLNRLAVEGNVLEEASGFFVGGESDGGFCAKLAFFSQGNGVDPALGVDVVNERLPIRHQRGRDGGQFSAQNGGELVVVAHAINDNMGVTIFFTRDHRAFYTR